jgi:hypothetical protein
VYPPPGAVAETVKYVAVVREPVESIMHMDEAIRPDGCEEKVQGPASDLENLGLVAAIVILCPA